MKKLVLSIAVGCLALTAPAAAARAQALEGKWANPKRSVIVDVAKCGDAYCGTVSWASERNRDKGVAPGTRVLSDLRPNGGNTYKGRAYEPKRGIRGSATVRQVSPNVMIVKGCAIAGLFCRDQRWTRVS